MYTYMSDVMNRDMPIATHIHIAIHANAYVHTAGVSENNGERSMGSI